MKIQIWDQLDKIEQKKLLMRSIQTFNDSLCVETKSILENVKTNGDKALFELGARYDGVDLTNLSVSDSEFKEAEQMIDSKNLSAIQFAIRQIKKYHQAQSPKPLEVETCSGVICSRIPKPIERVGLYVPGGSAPLVSTVMMLAVPAQLAQCRLRILCTPPLKTGLVDPHLLVTAKLCGIRKVFKLGGAQAIAAMAYGTETIPKVDKLFGPGNAWVTQAKMFVADDPLGASIDMPAGPSELLVIADETAYPEFVASDLLSQAEHGPDSQVICIATSLSTAELIMKCIEEQIETLPRKEIAKEALKGSRVFVVNSIQEGIAISNTYAPEHLSLQIQDPEKVLESITHAGAVFLGHWTPEAAGDYATGANHVLPTYGYATSISGLSLHDFFTYLSIQKLSKAGLKKIAESVERLAALENLIGHQKAISQRFLQGDKIE